MRRGEIYLADLGAPVGREQSLVRPVVVMSAQPWLDSNPQVVMVIPLTRTRRGAATHVEIEPGQSGLSATSYAKCEDLRAVSVKRLDKLFGTVDGVSMVRIEQIVARLLALP